MFCFRQLWSRSSCIQYHLHYLNFTLFWPFFIISINKLFQAHVGCTFEPIRSQNATAVGRITTRTAACFLRKNNPTSVIHCELLARSGSIGEDSSADDIVATISSIYSFSIVSRIIQKLSIDFVLSFVDDKSLVEVDFKGIVVYRWL